ncbi:stage II sporulation protein R [Desulfosporosinus sp. FKA]|uniref:stage II sporulation protein R n=1 Tax=Desulfosporosinus sp. FKA TaxID=1969834 RepID=UPI001FA8F42B|nr:stage II sporulation protein R [Desulfosporosinus sp. FKA]
MKWKKIIGVSMVFCIFGILGYGSLSALIWKGNVYIPTKVSENVIYDEGKLAQTPDQLIRFHVLANSDSEQDQALKRAVRDAVLKEVSPKLASSRSLQESRQILAELRPEMEKIGRAVVKAWGKNYSVHTEYGHFSFPTKSYGTLILPAGDYEALRVVIGEGKGSNWWCVLFPPLCFIDIEHSTAVQVDGKPGIPINDKAPLYSENQQTKQVNDKGVVNSANKSANNKIGSSVPGNSLQVKFYFWELVERLISRK